VGVVITAPENTAVGDQALASNTGFGNTAAGFQTLLSNTTGGDNTAVGTGALHNNTIGNNNTASGVDALLSNTTGSDNTANGENALYFNTTGNYNTGTGFQALNQNTTGSNNTATGYRALYTNSADNNTAYGYQALLSNTTGDGNTAIGPSALLSNTVGTINTAIGVGALEDNTTGSGNTTIGTSALLSNTTGGINTAIGVLALYYNTTGYSNTALGRGAGFNVTTAHNVISIGSDVVGENVSNSCYIGSIFGQTSSGGAAVFINSGGKLGTVTSSRRFKEDIKPMNNASDALLALKPVTFRYKKEIDPQGIPQFGLVAEEVEKVNPRLVVRDKDGKVNTVRYEAVNAMLLNEFLKEHKKVETQQATMRRLSSNAAEQEVTISELKKDMEILTAQLKEQAAEIQKVSAQVEMRRPLTRVARSYP
jgi:uncharacterized coiled-coil protein SlyX